MMSNPRKQLGTALENRVVRLAQEAGLEARKQPMSGVLKDYPSDAVIEQALIECKVRAAEIQTTGAKHIRLDLGWLAKVTSHAQGAGFDMGAVVFQAKGAQQRYVLLSFEDFLRLLAIQKCYSVSG